MEKKPMKKLFCALFICAFALAANAQKEIKVENDALFGEGCFYLENLPEDNSFNGVLFLIPGYLENPSAVKIQSGIVQESNKNGIAVVLVNLTKKNEDFPIDVKSIEILNKMIADFYKKRKVPVETNLYIGGFSIGGTAAIKFYTLKRNNLKINKVFAIDPPLDMVRLRRSLLKGRESSFAAKLDTLNVQHKPQLQSLQELSIYNPDFTELKMLPDYNSTSLRIYSEPDILWWVKNRGMDLSDMNVTDCAGYINKLMQKSPENKVELILTSNMGVRNNTQKHPHSWSIAEPVDLVKWLKQK